MKEAMMKSLVHQHIFKLTGQLIVDKELDFYDYMIMREMIPILHSKQNDMARVTELLGVVNNIIGKYVDDYKPITMKEAMKHHFDTIISLN